MAENNLGFIILGIVLAIIVCLFAYLVQTTMKYNKQEKVKQTIFGNLLENVLKGFNNNKEGFTPDYKHPSMAILHSVAENTKNLIAEHYNLHTVYDGISHNSDFLSNDALAKIKNGCEVGMRKIERALYIFANEPGAIAKTFAHKHQLKIFWRAIESLYGDFNRIYENILYTDHPEQYAVQLTFWLPDLYASAARVADYAENNGVLPKCLQGKSYKDLHAAKVQARQQLQDPIVQALSSDDINQKDNPLLYSMKKNLGLLDNQDNKENYMAASAGYSFPGMYPGDSQFDKDYQGRRSEFPDVNENFGQGDMSDDGSYCGSEQNLLGQMLNNLPSNNYGDNQNYEQVIKQAAISPKHIENHDMFVRDQKRFGQTSGAPRIRDTIEGEHVVRPYGLYGVINSRTPVFQGATVSTPSAWDGQKPFVQNNFNFVPSWRRNCN